MADLNPSRTPWESVVPSVILLVLASACGDSSAAPYVPRGPVTAPAVRALEAFALDACLDDTECQAGFSCFQRACVQECLDATDCAVGEACSPRGRCTVAGRPTTAEAEADLHLVTPPTTVFDVSPGQASVTLHLDLDAAIPTAGLAYRVERSDDPAAGTTLGRVTGTASVDIPIATGRSDPNHPMGALGVVATVTTAVGRFDVELRPRQSVAGEYAGEVVLSDVGSVPVTFSIVTEPDFAPLATATRAWLVLGVDASSFLMPETPADRAELAAPLTYSAVAGAYVATFRHAADVRPPYGMIFDPATGATSRGMRFEINQAGLGEVTGRFVDAWSGLFDVTGAGGALEPGETLRVGTLSGRRTGPGIDSAAAAALLPGAAAPIAAVAGLPPLTSCDATGATGITLDSVPSCRSPLGATDNLNWYMTSATPAQRAQCTVDHAAAVLASGATVEDTLAAYLGGTATLSGSFADFLDACASGSGGTCVPSRALLCSRQLAAFAYRGLAADPTNADRVFTAYVDTTREATLGPQLAAYWADYTARVDWLSSTDAAPAVVASALRQDAVTRMDAWKVAVLDRHVAALALQLDASARTMFARAPSAAGLDASRVSALVLASQSWRGAADSLTYAVRRWNIVVDAAAQRASKAALARTVTRDLYVTAAVLTELTGASGSVATASFRGAFANLQRGTLELAMPFDRLVFTRDAEVAVSTSLDPQNSSATLLADREATARTALADATAGVDSVIAGVVADSIQATTIVNGLTAELLATQNEIASLCGLPVGCSASQIGVVPTCAPPVADGRCGFLVDQSAGSIVFENGGNLSRAAAQVLEVRKAYNQLAIAAAERDAHESAVAYSYANLEAFAADVQDWNDTRAATLRQMADIFDQQNGVANDALAALIENRAAQARIREASIAGDTADLALWNRIRLDATAQQFKQLTEANNLATVSASLNLAADGIDFIAETTSSATTPPQLAAGLAIGAASFGLRGAAIGVDHLVAQRELAADRVATYADLQLEQLMAQADIGSAQTDAELEELEVAIETARGLSETQSAELGRALDLAREQRAAELAFARDLVDLRDRRFAHFQLVQQSPQFALEVDQAALAVQQRILEYHLTAQEAQLAEGRRALLTEQLSGSQALLGGPAAVFARVNRLDRAEQHLQLAKEAMMDWLTTLEYFAVRPFVDHRIRILLARNTTQLNAIANSLGTLSDTCGGTVSNATVTFSVRDDVLGLDRTITDIDGTSVAPAERFRRVLNHGSVPIDRRVRYSTSATVGQLLASDRSILAASFDLSLDDFANLQVTCNAKLVRFEVQLVGAIGSGLPAVTLLYDGTSHMRSCQPDIDAYVAAIGDDATNFGAVTLFRAAGRSASPVAGINSFTTGNANETLDGLPVASTYTLLIDTSAGDNARLDWSKLEDVLIRVQYSYQDAFPPNQCRE